MTRIESPSSINTYKQCPRKYFYRYFLELKTKPNIHQVRGKLTHSVLEDFYDIEIEDITCENFEPKLKLKIQNLFLDYWQKAKKELEQFNLSKEQHSFYFEETLMMLFNWFTSFKEKLNKIEGPTFKQKFEILKPIREQEFASKIHQVRGFIDAIEDLDGQITVIDYKTSSRYHISKEYKLQLAIYALLYHEKHNKYPDKAAIHFLKDRLKEIPVTQELVDLAIYELNQIKKNTISTNIVDYPKKESGLCKWSTGECDYYCVCSKKAKITDMMS